MTGESGLERRVGLFGATMVGVGAMVGAGIFVLAGVAMRVSGPGAMVAFALCGVITTITAFSWAELASAFPEAGGGYVFAKKVFPIGPAFAAGWVLWFAYVVACALYALGFAGFLAYAIEVAAERMGHELVLGPVFEVATAIASGLACVFLIALRGPGAGNLISFAKVVAFLALIVGGLVVFFGREAGTAEVAFDPLLPFGMTGVLAAMGYVFIALEGYEIIAAVSEEVKEPARTIPRAMFLSIGITLVIYMGLMFVVLTVGGEEGGDPAWKDLGERGDLAVAVAANRFGGFPGLVVVLVAGLLATFSALTATLLAASRVSFAMARDRVLPRRLSRTSGAQGTPLPALLASAGLVVVVILATADVEVAGAAASVIFLLSFLLANAAGLLVRARVGARAGFQAPLYPLLPLIGIACCLGLALFQIAVEWRATVVVTVWLVIGGLVYASFLRRSAETVSARTEGHDADLVKLRGRTPIVLVPIASPDRAVPLIHLANALAAPGIGRVLTLCVARYDPADMAATGPDGYARAETALRRAVSASAAIGRPFEAVVKLAEDVTATIAHVATERRPETILLGMTDLAQSKSTELLDRIIARTTADVVVLKAPAQWSLSEVKHVVIPVAGVTPHDPLRARVLGMLLKDRTRTVTLLRVLKPDEERERALRQLMLQADDLGLPPTSCVVEEPTDAVSAIVHHAEQADLVMLGLGRHRLIGKFAIAVSTGVSCPVIAIAQALRTRRS